MKVLARVKQEAMRAAGGDYEAWRLACEWAEANGIDPKEVPADSEVEVVLTDAGPAIRFCEWDRDDDGRTRILHNQDSGPGVATRERIVLCEVPMPDRIKDREAS